MAKIKIYEYKDALFRAAEEGNFLKVRDILAIDSSYLGVTNDEGRNCVHIATLNGHMGLVKQILAKHQYDITLEDKQNMTVVHMAAFGGFVDLFKFFEKKALKLVNEKFGFLRHYYAIKADVESFREIFKIVDDSSGRPKSIESMFEQQYSYVELLEHLQKSSKIFKEFLDKKPEETGKIMDVIGEKTGDYLPLRVQELLKSIIGNWLRDIFTKQIICNSKNQTPLHFAAKGNQFEMVKYLLVKKLDFCMLDKFNKTPIHYAILSGLEGSVFKELVKNAGDNINPTILHEAVKFGDSDIIKYIIETLKIDVDSLNHKRETALSIAVQLGKMEIVEKLVKEYKADPMLKLATPVIHIAVASGNINMVKSLFKKYGVKPCFEMLDKNGQNILFYVSRAENTKKMLTYILDLLNTLEDKELINNILNKSNVVDETALYVAAAMGNIDAIKLFVDQGADLYKVSKFGWNPIFCTLLNAVALKGLNVSNQHKSKAIGIVKYCLNKTEKQDIVFNGQMLFEIISKGHSDLTIPMIQVGADIDYINDTSKQTVLEAAVIAGDMKIVRLLINKGVSIIGNKVKCFESSENRVKKELESIWELAERADDIYNLDIKEYKGTSLGDQDIGLIIDRIKNRLVKDGLPDGYNLLEEYTNNWSKIKSENDTFLAIYTYLELQESYQVAFIKSFNAIAEEASQRYENSDNSFIGVYEVLSQNDESDLLEKFQQIISDLARIVKDKPLYNSFNELIKKYPELNNKVKLKVEDVFVSPKQTESSNLEEEKDKKILELEKQVKDLQTSVRSLSEWRDSSEDFSADLSGDTNEAELG